MSGTSIRRSRFHLCVMSMLLLSMLLLSMTGVRSVSLHTHRIKRSVIKTRLSLSPQQLGTFECLSLIDDAAIGSRSVELFDWSGSDPIPFQQGWDFQRDLLAQHVNRLQSDGVSGPSRQFEGYDSVIMLQHTPVYTLGTSSDPNFIKGNSISSVDVVRMDRGGEVTYHGPGQLVIYPVLDLRGYKQDIHWYMRALEETTLLALQRAGVSNAVRENGVTGVWIDGNKVAALGIKAKRWITQHGLAINVEAESLANFEGIVPCGLEGREVTCVNDHLDQKMTVKDFAVLMKDAMQEIFFVRLMEAES